MARNPQGFGGDWRPRSGCLAEWGSTTGPQRGPGAEGGQLQAFAFASGSGSGSGHRCAAAAARTKAARKDEENDDHRQRKRTEEYQAGGGKAGAPEAHPPCPRTLKGYGSFGLFMPHKEKGAASTKLTAPL